MLVLSVILGALMYMIEPHDKAFTSIPRSIYWCIVTLTTVGYGDVVPTTSFGQIMASIIMILGYGIIAVPTGIVTSEYSRTYRKKEPHKSDISHKIPQDIGYPHSHTHSHCKYCNAYPLPDGALYCPQCGAKQ